MDIMSRDESGYDEDYSNEVIVSSPLKWLSANATRKLDGVGLKNKTPQSKRQMKLKVYLPPVHVLIVTYILHGILITKNDNP